MDQTETLTQRLRTFYDLGACYLDDMELEKWAGLFVEDARYRLMSRENYDQDLTSAEIYCDGLPMIHDRITAIHQALVYEERYLRHFISSVKINAQDGNIIRAQASFQLIESISDNRPKTILIGRYIDVLIDEGSSLKIRDRSCVYDNHWAPRAVIIPV